ncbi:MAG: cyclic nucleotide-binding domain-containing protein [Bdellovibrionota bacterium]
MENRVSKGTHEVLFREGEFAQSLYIVKRGQVLCLKRSKDRLIPVFRAEEGDILGENAILNTGAYGYSAVTITTAELMEIPSDSFKQILAKSPSWLLDLTSTMVQRFENTANLIAENRVFNDSIISEEDFPSSLEVEFKKLLN